MRNIYRTAADGGCNRFWLLRVTDSIPRFGEQLPVVNMNGKPKNEIGIYLTDAMTDEFLQLDDGGLDRPAKSATKITDRSEATKAIRLRDISDA